MNMRFDILEYYLECIKLSSESIPDKLRLFRACSANERGVSFFVRYKCTFSDNSKSDPGLMNNLVAMDSHGKPGIKSTPHHRACIKREEIEVFQGNLARKTLISERIPMPLKCLIDKEDLFTCKSLRHQYLDVARRNREKILFCVCGLVFIGGIW